MTTGDIEGWLQSLKEKVIFINHGRKCETVEVIFLYIEKAEKNL